MKPNAEFMKSDRHSEFDEESFGNIWIFGTTTMLQYSRELLRDKWDIDTKMHDFK